MGLYTGQIGVIYLILCTGYISSQTNNDLDLGDVEKPISAIPGLENFNSSKLPSAEDIEALIKEKCIKNGGGEEAFDALKNQHAEFQSCIEAQLNTTQIQLELEEAKKTGSMDEVFGKYCRKYPEIYDCIQRVVDKINPCLNAAEQETLNQTAEIVDKIKEFVCFRDGDRIAMFVAEGGVECLESRQEQLEECFNETLGSRIPKDMSLNSLPSFVFSNKDCRDFNKIQTCLNEELDKCNHSIPVNLVSAFLKFLKKTLSCANLPNQAMDGKEDDNSSNSIVISSFVIVISVIICKLF